MTDKPSERRIDSADVPASTSERLVYVMPEYLVRDSSDDALDLRQLWATVWTGKWRIIIVSVLFAAASLAYALLATEWYRAEVLLAPAEEKSAPSLAGQLGGLAALAGVSIGGGDSVEAVATLKSRDFAREFIEDLGLLNVFFREEWDAATNRWVENDPTKQPDIRDAVRYFQEEVLKVSEDRQTGLLTLGIEWTDPAVAAEWAMILTQRLNGRLRERALRDAESNVQYLQDQLADTNVVTLQLAISSVLESELQKLMLARGNEEFAFRIIDTAQPPRDRASPNRSLVVILGTLVGGILGVSWVLIGSFFRSSER